MPTIQVKSEIWPRYSCRLALDDVPDAQETPAQSNGEGARRAERIDTNSHQVQLMHLGKTPAQTRSSHSVLPLRCAA